MWQNTDQNNSEYGHFSRCVGNMAILKNVDLKKGNVNVRVILVS